MTNLAGQTLGRYQIIERLGRGGMADVYKGFHPGLERYVAVKVMHAHLAENEDFVTRFRREAKSVSGLRHPNIVQVFDFDTIDEYYFMVMEYVEGGQSLKELLADLHTRGERLPVATTLDIVAKLADALDYAHGQGMIHRDIKPGNVLVPSLEQPLLSDFGIARLLDQTGLTASGAMVGTPAYMSPEQGRGEQADARADIYALGIMLYEMLVGKPPYDADTPYGVILKHINDPLPSPRTLDPTLPDGVEGIVLKALAKDPDLRYQTAGALRDALKAAQDAIQRGETVPASIPSPAPETIPMEAVPSPVPETIPLEDIPSSPPEETAQMEPAAGGGKRGLPTWVMIVGGVGVLAIVALVIAAALGVFSGGGQVADTTGGNPTTASNSTAAPNATGVSSTGGNSEADQFAAEGLQALFVQDSDTADSDFQQALALDPNNADALAGSAVLAWWGGDTNSFYQLVDQAAASNPDSPMVNYVIGAKLSWGDNTDAEQAMAAFTQAINSCGDNRPLCAAALYERANLNAGWFGELDAALADINQSIDMTDDPAIKANSMTTRADIYNEMGNPDMAISEYEDAYALHPESFEWAMENAAELALRNGDFDRAGSDFQRLVDDTHGDPAYVAYHGYVQLVAGNLDGAIAEANQAQQFQADLLPAIYLQGLIALQQGNADAAHSLFQSILDRQDEWYNDWAYGLFQPDLGHELHYDNAQSLAMLGLRDEALAEIDLSTQENDWWPEPFLLKGDILRDSGDLAGARESYLHAAEIAQNLGRDAQAADAQQRADSLRE